MTIDGLRDLDRSAVRRLAARVRGLIDDEGISYNALDAAAATDPAEPGPWRLDPLPVLFGADEWDGLARGVAQRSLLLDAVLKDFYGEQRTLRTGTVPPEVLFAHPGYIRRAVGVPAPGPRSLFLHGVDIGEAAGDEVSGYVAVADRTQAPSGVGYALADRRVTSRALPREFRTETPRPVSSFAAALRVQLVEAAPPGIDDPTVVVLSPGSFSETAFDQAYLASVLGFPLVEASDLTVRDGGVFMRSLGRMKRVHVIARRVDSEFSDPLDLRTDSQLGVVGLVEMMTRGAVTVVNTLGSGVLENPALHAYLPQLCRDLLDEDLLLPSTPTVHAATAAGRAAIEGPLDERLVLNFGTGERFSGPALTDAQADELRRRVAADPTVWCVKTLVPFTARPAAVDGAVTERGFAMRAFSLAQESGYTVLPGGLGQVLLGGADGALLESSAARDVWVPTPEDLRTSARVATAPREGRTVAAASGPVATPRVLSDQFWIGRYAERAEATVRMLSMAHDRSREFRHRPWQAGADVLAPLLDAVVAATVTDELGPIVVEGPEQTDVLARLRRLTLDVDVPGSVAHSGVHLRACLRAVRDQMSTDTWLVLSGAERSLGRLAVDPDDAGEQLDQTLGEVLVSLLAFAGLGRESLVQDPAWLMMDAGRRIERGLQLSAVTRAMVVPENAPEIESGLLDAYLVTCESAVTYRRRHRGVLRAGAAVDLMFLDATNPRSLVSVLTALSNDLGQLPDELRSATCERTVSEALARLGRFDLDDVDAVADGRRSELEALLDGVDDGLREVSDVLERTRFAPPAAARPLWVGVQSWA